jgi:Fe-Mn family superoxide dismutase
MQNNGHPTRREMIKTSLAAVGLFTLAGRAHGMRSKDSLPNGSDSSGYAAASLAGSLGALGDLRYPFELPELPYGVEAFTPKIDAATMEIHHSRHHAGYVRKLNTALESHPQWQSMPLGQLLTRLDELPDSIRTAVRNNGGGHANHSLYWSTMRPGGSQPTGQLAADIDRDFGGLDTLRSELKAAALGQFGSGWAWLVAGADGHLKVSATANQDNPVMLGQRPLFGIDVWEHAYYLNYQNRRGDYVDAFLDLADWSAVAANYAVSSS